jgi:hypothetical protein
MLLRTGLATAALSLLLATTASADATQRVVNGGFEEGTGNDAPPWTLTIAAACTPADCPQAAASGSRYAATLPSTVAPFGFQTSAIISQTLRVPETPATLTFALRRIAQGESPDMGVNVKLGGTTVKSIDTFSDQFETVTVVLPPAAASPSEQLLEFQVTCSNSSSNNKECDRIDLDDVSIISGSPPDPPAITGTDPASPADNTTPSVRGTVGAGAPSEIRIYTNPTCSGSPAAMGTAADFTGAGIPVTVADGSTTSLSARSSNLAGASGCSNSISYVELGPPQPADPATGLSGLRSKFVVGRLGVLVLGKGANPPVSSTAQKLTVGGAGSSAKRAKPPLVIGRGKTTIPAGTTQKLKLSLNRKGKRLLRKRRKLTAQLTIVAKGPTGLTSTVTKTVKLKLKRPRR